MSSYSDFAIFINKYHHFSIIQAENPDGDSLGSALGLDYILAYLDDSQKANPNHNQREHNTSRDITLYCPVDIPKYLRYYPDWSRITNEFDFGADAYIIVDTAASILLSSLMENQDINHALNTKPVFVLDHHESTDDLPFEHFAIIEPLPSCCSLIYKIATNQNLPISQTAAEYLFQGLLSDTLGLTTDSVSGDTFRTAAALQDLGANITHLENLRREYMKKSPRILEYKADLIKRVEYHLDNQLATIHIPWEDIRLYSDEYNPAVLIMEELRMVKDLKISAAIKTYPDGKVTGKIRSTEPIADQIAGYFGGGGHPFAAGFRTYDTNYDEVVRELIQSCYKILKMDQPNGK